MILYGVKDNVFQKQHHMKNYPWYINTEKFHIQYWAGWIVEKSTEIIYVSAFRSM